MCYSIIADQINFTINNKYVITQNIDIGIIIFRLVLNVIFSHQNNDYSKY